MHPKIKAAVEKLLAQGASVESILLGLEHTDTPAHPTCPFCDSMNLAAEYDGPKHYIACQNCGAAGPAGSEESAAWLMWNGRSHYFVVQEVDTGRTLDWFVWRVPADGKNKLEHDLSIPCGSPVAARELAAALNGGRKVPA